VAATSQNPKSLLCISITGEYYQQALTGLAQLLQYRAIVDSVVINLIMQLTVHVQVHIDVPEVIKTQIT
jgi:hypothetical protein